MGKILFNCRRWPGVLYLLPLFVLLFHLGAKGETSEVTIGAVSGFTQYMPLNQNRDYVYTETVYPASDVEALGDCKITKLAFRGYSDIVTTAKFEVYLANTSKLVVPTSVSDLSTLTKVYEGQASTVVRPSSDSGEVLAFDLPEGFFHEKGKGLHVITKSEGMVLKRQSLVFWS